MILFSSFLPTFVTKTPFTSFFHFVFLFSFFYFWFRIRFRIWFFLSNPSHKLIVESCASPSDNLFSLSYWMPVFSVNLVGLFFLGVELQFYLIFCEIEYLKLQVLPSKKVGTYLLAEVLRIFFKKKTLVSSPKFHFFIF